MDSGNSAQSGDIFSLAWEDEAGGIASDARAEEPLPDEPGEEPEAAPDAENAAPEADTPARFDGGEYVGPPARARTAEERDREIGQFAAEFPGVMPEDIPGSVWERVRAGESLAAAFSRHEAARLRRENARLETQLAGKRQAETNRQRAAGSQIGAGSSGPAHDPFDDGWELEW